MKKHNAIGAQRKDNAFKTAVQSIPAIASGYCNGLQALRQNSVAVQAADTKRLTGSVDIDAATKRLYPNDSRWDYAIGYAAHAYFVEVHPANTANVCEMVKKVEWLRQWLKNEGTPLDALMEGDGGGRTFYWIPSGRCAILPNSPQSRLIAKHHLIITKRPMLLK